MAVAQSAPASASVFAALARVGLVEVARPPALSCPPVAFAVSAGLPGTLLPAVSQLDWLAATRKLLAESQMLHVHVRAEH